jgi:quercetin dioxygenase-like cupin family protein
MQIIRNDPSQVTPIEAPIFRGNVSRRELIGAPQSDQLTVLLVSFGAGGRNVFHTHTFDQVLYITDGEGIVASEAEEHVVREGDIVIIPAGEKHWHGGTETSAMSHLAIGTPGETTIAD